MEVGVTQEAYVKLGYVTFFQFKSAPFPFLFSVFREKNGIKKGESLALRQS